MRLSRPHPAVPAIVAVAVYVAACALVGGAHGRCPHPHDGALQGLAMLLLALAVAATALAARARGERAVTAAGWALGCFGAAGAALYAALFFTTFCVVF